MGQRQTDHYPLPVITLLWSLTFVTVTEAIHRLIVNDNRETWARVSETEIRVTERNIGDGSPLTRVNRPVFGNVPGCEDGRKQMMPGSAASHALSRALTVSYTTIDLPADLNISSCRPKARRTQDRWCRERLRPVSIRFYRRPKGI